MTPQQQKRMEHDIERALEDQADTINAELTDVQAYLRGSPLLETLEDSVTELKRLQTMNPAELLDLIDTDHLLVIVWSDDIGGYNDELLALVEKLKRTLSQDPAGEVRDQWEAAEEDAYDARREDY